MQEKTKTILKNWRYHFYTLNRPPQNVYSDRGFHHYKCIFFHIPKTGGVSISHSIFKNLGLGHITVDYAKKHFTHETIQYYFKFSIVRNPYERLYSSFQFLKNGGFHDRDNKWAKKNLAEFDNFESFVMEWLNGDSCYLKTHFIPQHHFIVDSSIPGIFVDFCGRFEQINKDFSFICKKLGIKRKLIYTNQTKNISDNTIQLSSEMKKQIISCYAKDFELFNYPTLL